MPLSTDRSAPTEQRLDGCNMQPVHLQNNGSVGLCGNAGAFVGYGVSLSFCIVITPGGIGFTRSVGTGAGLGASVGLQAISSNATSMQQYTGWFTGPGASVPTPWGFSVSGDYQTGLDSNNRHINVGSLGVGFGLRIPGITNIFDEVNAPTWEGHGSASYTWVNGPFNP